MKQEEMIQRILHIVDQKLTLFEMGQEYNKAVELENSIGYGHHWYGLIGDKKTEIEKQIEVINTDINELMLMVTQEQDVGLY